jgi:hypothetical protein
MQWLIRQWASIKNLEILVRWFSPEWVPPQQARPLTRLQALSVMHLPLQDDTVPNDLMEWVVWVLCHCPVLKVLTLFQVIPTSWPPLRSLRHLDLSAQAFGPDTCMSFQGLWALRTLRIAGPPMAAEMVDVGPLLLSHLPSFQRLSLCMVHPAQLVLPASCMLSFLYAGPISAGGPDLSSIHHALDVAVFHGDALEHVPTEALLHQLGEHCAHLRCLYDAIGSAAVPLHFPSSLASLTVLHLSAPTILISLPGCMRLHVMCLEAVSLDVQLDSAAALADSLTDCSIAYEVLHGIDLLLLFAFLGDAGKCAADALVKEQQGDGSMMMRLSVHGSEFFQDVQRTTFCPCGACTKCLVRSCGCESECLNCMDALLA